MSFSLKSSSTVAIVSESQAGIPFKNTEDSRTLFRGVKTNRLPMVSMARNF